MAGGSQDFTELRERSLQIKKRLECLWLRFRELTNGVPKKMIGDGRDRTSEEDGHRFASG